MPLEKNARRTTSRLGKTNTAGSGRYAITFGAGGRGRFVMALIIDLVENRRLVWERLHGCGAGGGCGEAGGEGGGVRDGSRAAWSCPGSAGSHEGHHDAWSSAPPCWRCGAWSCGAWSCPGSAGIHDGHQDFCSSEVSGEARGSLRLRCRVHDFQLHSSMTCKSVKMPRNAKQSVIEVIIAARKSAAFAAEAPRAPSGD